MLPSRLINRHLLNGIPSSPLYRRKLIGLVVRPSLVRTTPTILNHYRPLTTESIPANEAGSIIASQRKNRPTSPHLSIYKPQITWYLSMTHRITGAILSGGVYVFGAAYLVSPLFGWHLDVATMAAAFGSLPVAAKVGVKSLVAFPFVFHSMNGLRHLTWDTGAALSNKAVIRTGWTVVGLSSVTAIALAMM